VAEVTAGALVVTAQNTPTTQMVVEFASDGTPVRQSSPDRFVRLLAGLAGGPWVVATSETDRAQTTVTVDRPTGPEIPVASHALAPLQAVPPMDPRPTFLEVGEHALSVAVLLPRRELGLTGPFPVLMAPYGGPHHQRVVASRLAYADDQYLADQGFCVVVADGRGTGGRGPAWDRWMHRDLGEVAVEDQVAALAGVVEHLGTDVVDPGRVGVVGWSFGGYLAARCVLARPDVFHAAVAGAPVTDWAWYDTGYTERYLGLPEDDAARWERQSLLPLAAGLERPLLLIHGYLDDNVFFAHTQLLSDALTAAGRPHRVLGLSGITHMAADPVVAENLLRLQVGFFQEALG
jgi:dipeptidyl-peptidase-4